MTAKLKKTLLLPMVALALMPAVAWCEYESSYKQKTEQQYRAVAQKNANGIVSELGTHSQAALSSQIEHMNAYEKAKYVQKMNMYYGTNHTADSLESAGNDYANKVRLNVENSSRATVVEHAADIEKMKSSAMTAYGVSSGIPQGMDEKTYERMLKTQEEARSSGALGMDYAKGMIASPTSIKDVIQGNQGK